MRGLTGFLMLGALTAAIGCGGSGSPAMDGTGGSGGKGASATGGSGASGGAGGGACQPFIAGDGIITWDEAGVAECATATLGMRMTSTGLDFLEIIGATFGTQSSIGIGLTVSSYVGPLGGTYSCKGDATAAYTSITYTTGTVQDCTVTITNPGAPGGAHATGTFSATVVVAGASVQLTQGAFDTPVMTTGG